MKAPRRGSVSAAITKPQIATIMLICQQFGISKEDRVDLLQDRYKKSSTADLTSDQAGHFIAEYERKGFVIVGAKSCSRPHRGRSAIPRKTGNVIALVSPDEIDKINAVAALIEWRAANGLALFLEKRMRIREGKVRTSSDAYLAIEGLKKMFENQMKAKYGIHWWRTARAIHESPLRDEIIDYIDLHCPQEYR